MTFMGRKTLYIAALFILAVSFWAVPIQTQLRPASAILYEGARLIPGDRSPVIASAAMLVENGIITLVAHQAEGQCSYKTLEELQADLDPNIFWRTHRSYVVNINHIREVVPWFKSSYQVRVDDKKGTEIPVSRVQTRRLREMLKL